MFHLTKYLLWQSMINLLNTIITDHLCIFRFMVDFCFQTIHNSISSSLIICNRVSERYLISLIDVLYLLVNKSWFALFLKNRKVELWCGQSNGNICIFVLGNGIVTGQDVVNHYDPMIAGLEVLQMVATDNLVIENTIDVYDFDEDTRCGENTVSGPVVWSYVYPGCVVYRWDPITRRVLHRLDCSKLAPCSESLQSISIEEHLSPGRCQVISLKFPSYFSCYDRITTIVD